MINIQFDLRDMDGTPLSLGDKVRYYDEDSLDEDGKITDLFVLGKIIWHNGSGYMHPAGIFVELQGNKIVPVCTLNRLNKDDLGYDTLANTCWYIKKA